MEISVVLSLVLSACAIAVTVYRDRLNVGKLSINAFVADVAILPGESSQSQVISITITNAGLKNIIVNGHCFIIENGNKMFFPDICPYFSNKKLEPGEYLTITVPNSILQTLIEASSDLKGFCVIDSLDRQWFLGKKTFDKLVISLEKKKIKLSSITLN